MELPYGEWIIVSLALLTYVQKRPSRRLFQLLVIAWLIGKCVEVVFPWTLPWHWHFARLMVMFAFWGWSWVRDGRRISPLIYTTFVLSMETLFFVNQPGIIPYESLFFLLALFLVSRLTAHSYWGTASAFTGSILLNQVFMRFTYEGIMSRADFPDPFIWNFGIGLLTVWAGLRLGWLYYKSYEHKEERELQ